MPIISSFYGIDIMMFYDDHNPPHFHAKYGDYKALIDINKARVLSGKLPSAQLKMVLAWAVIHKEELLEDWRLAELMEGLSKIEPLR
ncbi:MAG: DUF4160 domain-containing protein [Lachnospiraceae bacterium]|jgi:hypothetical protein|nr:DUF4160 domain-containing protein [Lachnospiraceae bacterium]